MIGKQEDLGLEERLDKAHKALSAILEIGTTGAGAMGTGEKLQEIMRTLLGLLEADYAMILVREGDVLEDFMGIGAGEGPVESFTVPMGQGLEGKIAETKKHLYVYDAKADPLVINPYLKEAGIRSMLGVPMLYGGEALGVLETGWKETHPFSDMELRMIKMAAERCASEIAIAMMCEANNNLSLQACMYLDIIEHDLKSLSRVMHDDLDTALSIPGLDRDVKDAIEAVKRDVVESETIVDNVRIMHHTLSEDLPVETMDLDSLIQDAIKKVEWPETKGVKIHYSPEMGRALNGTVLLKDVFYTLINNAIMCSRGDVIIDIRVDKAHAHGKPFYVVSIVDDSQAIPDEVKQELFDFHPGITQVHGEALPLFLVKLIVERHGGSIMVESRVPEDYKKGSVFRVVLPAIEAKVVPEAEPAYR